MKIDISISKNLTNMYNQNIVIFHIIQGIFISTFSKEREKAFCHEFDDMHG